MTHTVQWPGWITGLPFATPPPSTHTPSFDKKHHYCLCPVVVIDDDVCRDLCMLAYFLLSVFSFHAHKNELSCSSDLRAKSSGCLNAFSFCVRILIKKKNVFTSFVPSTIFLMFRYFQIHAFDFAQLCPKRSFSCCWKSERLWSRVYQRTVKGSPPSCMKTAHGNNCNWRK